MQSKEYILKNKGLQIYQGSKLENCEESGNPQDDVSTSFEESVIPQDAVNNNCEESGNLQEDFDNNEVEFGNIPEKDNKTNSNIENTEKAPNKLKRFCNIVVAFIIFGGVFLVAYATYSIIKNDNKRIENPFDSYSVDYLIEYSETKFIEKLKTASKSSIDKTITGFKERKNFIKFLLESKKETNKSDQTKSRDEKEQEAYYKKQLENIDKRLPWLLNRKSELENEKYSDY